MTDFSKTRGMFDIPDGMIYLNGNSLGPMPKAAPEAINRFLNDEWKTELIKGWNTCNWFMQTNSLGVRVGRLIGAVMARAGGSADAKEARAMLLERLGVG